MKSYTKIPNEILGPSQIGIVTRYLYCVLLKYCGRDEWCFPSQNRLAKDLNCSERHIRNLLEELEENNFLFKSRRGFNRSNTYKLSRSLILDRQPTSEPNGNSDSFHIGTLLPLHQGNGVPPKTTYLKGKGKRSLKGLESLRKYMEEKGIKQKSKNILVSAYESKG